MSMTVSSAVRWWARQKPDQVALIVGDDSTTYAELENWTSRVARSLAERGVREGDVIGVIGRNTLQWAVTAVAVVKLGAVLLPLNNRFKRRELAGVISEMGARIVLGDTDFIETFADMRLTEAGDPPGPDDSGAVEFIPLSWVSERRDGAPDQYRGDRDPNEAMLVMLTSGSTGRPKGVIYTNTSILAMIFEWSLMEETVRPGIRIFLPVPFAFAPGTVWGLMRTMTLGGTLVFQNRFDANEAIELLQKHDVQVCLGGPIIYEQMARTPAFETAKFPHLRTAITGGARVPVELLRTWLDKGLAIRQLYGMSEVGGITTATTAEDAFDHPDSCGYGGIFSEFKVVRPDGTECEPGEEGEILSRTPGATPGYWNDPQQTASLLRDGWIHSNDVGYVTEDGRLKFVDRARDLIISGGINISPAEIESVIGTIPGVEEVVVISAPNDRYGEVPAAIVRLTDGTSVAQVLAVCNEQLADFKVPRFIVDRVDPLPRLASGKIAKAVVRAEYPDIPASPPRSGETVQHARNPR